MVLMIDGSANPFLGSQVGAALFGYVLGVQASVVSFRAGRTLAAWFQFKSNPHIFDMTEHCSSRDGNPLREEKRFWSLFLAQIIPAIIAIILVTLYFLGDFYWGISFYRQLWIACLVGPFGTIARWKLSAFNGTLNYHNLRWFPLGTFLANFIATIVSVVMLAATTQFQSHGGWEMPILKAISLGFAGSLSTVSTFAKEIVEMGDKNPHFDRKAFLYWAWTLFCCCSIGLLIYCPIVRFG